jgi:hypothetical protein
MDQATSLPLDLGRGLGDRLFPPDTQGRPDEGLRLFLAQHRPALNAADERPIQVIVKGEVAAASRARLHPHHFEPPSSVLHASQKPSLRAASGSHGLSAAAHVSLEIVPPSRAKDPATQSSRR